MPLRTCPTISWLAARPLRRAASVVCVTAAVGVIAACDSHAPVGGISAAPTYSAAVRPIAACAPGVRVPAAVSAVTPRATMGPTAVLRVGDAVELSGAAESRVGLTGLRGAAERSVVCRAQRADRTVLVAAAPGYVRIGVVAAGVTAPKLVFVKVNA